MIKTRSTILILAAAVMLFMPALLAAQDTMPSGYWFIRNARAAGGWYGAWDQPGRDSRYSKGKNIGLYNLESGTDYDKQYRFSSVGGGWYNIVDRSGGYVDVSGGENRNGANIQVWDRNGSDSQKFRFVRQSNGYYKIYTRWGRVLATKDDSASDGINVHTWQDHNSYNAYWEFISPSTHQAYRPTPPAPKAPTRQAPPPPARQAPPPPRR